MGLDFLPDPDGRYPGQEEAADDNRQRGRRPEVRVGLVPPHVQAPEVSVRREVHERPAAPRPGEDRAFRDADHIAERLRGDKHGAGGMITWP